MSKQSLAAVKDGEITLGEQTISCAVLNDEKRTRVLSQFEIVKALGRAQGGSKRGEANLPRWISAKNISAYISEDLMKAIIEPIEYINTKGRRALGIEAKYLPQICTVWLNAQDDGVLTEHQEETAARANVLVRGLAHIGIIALVDEATGYQYERERLELQKILAAYISEEILKWQLTFTDEFYKEVYRLWGLPFIPKYIKNKPSFIGKLTTKYIYEEMPKGIIEKIKDKTGKTTGGHWRYKWHQSLTPEIGREHLKKQIIEVTTLMSIAKTKEQFQSLFKQKYGKDVQLELEFNEQPPKEDKLSEFNQKLKIALEYKPEK